MVGMRDPGIKRAKDAQDSMVLMVKWDGRSEVEISSFRPYD